MGHMVKNQTTEIRVKLCTLRADLGMYVFYGGYITHGTNTHTHTHTHTQTLKAFILALHWVRDITKQQ